MNDLYFIKRLSFLVGSGMPLLRCLLLMKNQSSQPKIRKVLEELSKDVSSGQTLSKSMKSKKLFDQFVITIIEVGEQSGKLGDNLTHAALVIERARELKQKIIGSLLYPACIGLAGIAVSLFLTLYIFPKVMPIFQSARITLPLSTRILIGVVGVVTHYWLAIIGILAFCTAAVFYIFIRHKGIRYLSQKVLLRIPIVGSIISHIAMNVFCRNLGLLLRSGLRLDASIVIIESITTHQHYKQAFARLQARLEAGQTLASFLKEFPYLFPEFSVDMIGVGETTGNLVEALASVEKFHQAELETFSKQLTGLIEPLLMIVIGLVIGFVSLAIITPIYEITQSIHR